MVSATLFSQINLVHTFNGQATPLTGWGVIDETAYFYSWNNSSVLIYDSNFSLYKSVSISIPTGYTLNSVSIAYYNIFAVNKFGFVIHFINPSNQSNNEYQLSQIIDEDGNILCDLGKRYTSGLINVFYMNKSWYLLDTEYMWNDEHTGFEIKTCIYSLPGTQNYTSANNVVPQKNTAPYPNPASSNINIPIKNNSGNLNIFDINGRLIQTLSADGETINLNVSGYPSGQYLYEQNGSTNRFIVQ